MKFEFCDNTTQLCRFLALQVLVEHLGICCCSFGLNVPILLNWDIQTFRPNKHQHIPRCSTKSNIISTLGSTNFHDHCKTFVWHILLTHEYQILSDALNLCIILLCHCQYEREPPSTRSTSLGAYRSASHFVVKDMVNFTFHELKETYQSDLGLFRVQLGRS